MSKEKTVRIRRTFTPQGASHNATIRALAFKWIRILFRCWMDRTPYDESRYLSALQKRRSPLLKFAARAPS
jgi:hypothetical protein